MIAGVGGPNDIYSSLVAKHEIAENWGQTKRIF